jgi:hypothetical protein
LGAAIVDQLISILRGEDTAMLGSSFVARAFVVISLSAGTAAAADSPPIKTTFRFEARAVWDDDHTKSGDLIGTYNENQNFSVRVHLPPGFGRWECYRGTPGLVDNREGRMRGGFFCTNDGGKTASMLFVGCKTTDVESFHSSAMRIYAPRPDSDAGADAGARVGASIELVASCESTR